MDDPVNFIDPWGETGVGHHFFPRQHWKNIDLSKEARDVFNKTTTGPIPEGHGWDKSHKAYNEAVGDLWNTWIKKKGIDPATMTAEQADEFLKVIQKSGNPAIKEFLEEIAKKLGKEACKKFLDEFLDKIFHLEMPALPPEIYMMDIGLIVEEET